MTAVPPPSEATRPTAPAAGEAPGDEKPRRMRAGALNAALRIVTTAARFVMMIGLVRYLTPADIGLYGIFSSTLSFVVFTVGLEFQSFNGRELLRAQRADVP